MQIQIAFSVRSVAAALIVLGASRIAWAGSECIEQPNQEPAAGQHWYYHLDRTNDRKCWYLGTIEPPAPQAATVPNRQPVADPSPQPSLSGWFESIGAALSGKTPAGTSPDAAEGDAGATQPAKADVAKSASVDPSIRPHVARRSDPDDARAANVHRQSPPRSELARADQSAGSSINQTERDALFQEFLRWREQHKDTP